MLRATVFVLAVATSESKHHTSLTIVAVLGDEKGPLMLFQPNSKTHMEDVVVQYDSKGQCQSRAAALSRFALV